jgi:hypothetical protein
VRNKIALPIDPARIYYVKDLRPFSLPDARAVRHEHHHNGLRIGKRRGRLFVLGAWLLKWFEAGELSRRESVHRNGDVYTGQGAST